MVNKSLKMNQVVSIERGTKSRTDKVLTEAYHTIQKEALFTGLARRYTPKDDSPDSPTGEKLPDENKQVQQRTDKLVEVVQEALLQLFDVCAWRDWGNTKAKADIVVGGTVIAADVPTTYLMFLDKKLVDVHTFISKLPVLDPSEKWKWDGNQSLFATDSVGTARTKKVTKALTLAPATDKHPAQVKEITDDVFAGTWNTIKYSSALPADVSKSMLKRVEELQKAVKFSMERANETEVDTVLVGKNVLDFVFAPMQTASSQV